MVKITAVHFRTGPLHPQARPEPDAVRRPRDGPLQRVPLLRPEGREHVVARGKAAGVADSHAEPGEPEGLVERYHDSVVSGRGLDDPALGVTDSEEEATRAPVDTRPMLAQSSESLPSGEAWCFELKLDGIRAIGWARPTGEVGLFSRSGQPIEETFPEIGEALELWARRTGSELVVDGEIVAVAHGGAAGWEVGAGDRVRTGDIQLGKLTLYRLSYARPSPAAS